MKVLVVAPMQSPEVMEIGEDLAAMQAVVGGPIQAVYPFEEPVALICHEEGKLVGLPRNRVLRDAETGEIYDIVAGTFFLCAAPPEGDSFAALTAEQVARYRARFRHPELFVEAAHD